MLTLIIGNKNYSSWSLRAWLVAKRAGVAFEEIVIPLDRPETHAEILRHSPSARVPALRDGSVTVWDSLAIAEYLAERFPPARLWPADPAARAMARAVSAEMHSGFSALRTHLPMNIRRRTDFADRGGAEVAADVARVLQIWRDCRARHGDEADGPFLFGAFSIADAMYAPVVTRFTSYSVPIEDPVARAYMAAVWDLPEMREWRADAQAEPWKAKYDDV